MIIGGEIGSGILWMFILPPFVFFLLGKKDGLLLGTLTFVLSLFFLIDPYHIIGTFPYAAAIKAEFLAIYGVTVLMAYSVESARQRYQEGMENEQLKLQSEIKERIRAEEELSSYRHHLEESVQQRTSELTVANEKLMIEAEERKRAEEILRDREEKYRTLFEESRDTIYITTPEGKFIDINQVGLEFFGYTKEELMNLNVKEIYVDPDDRLRFRQKIEREGFVRDYEIKFRKKDGTEMDCLLTSTLRQAIDGSILGYQGIIRDITGRRRAEAERERLLTDLEAKNREMDAFVYTISHDLKTPLVSLNGFSGALLKESYSQLGKEGKHYLERIQVNVVHMDALITSLLDLSRIGRVVGPIEEINVRPLLREIRDELAVRLKEAGAEFVVPEPLPTVRADRGRLRQVFANLIDNAIKYRSAERALRIEVGCRQEAGFYRFYVADNGIGIAPRYHDQIFTPFRKLHPETEGVGVGLAIVKKIVEHHGGRVWVESPSAEFIPSQAEGLKAGDEGTGATFYFTLPIE